MLRYPRFDVARPVSGAPLRVVVLTEHVDATYYAYFHYLLHSLADDKRVSFYVLSGRTMARHWRHVSLVATVVSRWINPHLVIFNRYALPWGSELARRFRRRGIPMVYHLDDDLLALPPELGDAVSAHHGAAEILRARHSMLTLVDHVQPSTERLGDRLRTRIAAARVMRPLHPPYLGSLLAAQEVAGPEHAAAVVGYMASKSHARDLEMVLPAVIPLLEARQIDRFEIFGTLAMPAELERRFPGRVVRHDVLGDYRQFLRRLVSLRWSVGLAPLLPTSFNACKSAIKYLEYTACGIPTVASAVPAYAVVQSGKNGLVAHDRIEWSDCIGDLLQDRHAAATLVRQARQDCEREFGIEHAKARLLRRVTGVATAVRAGGVVG